MKKKLSAIRGSVLPPSSKYFGEEARAIRENFNNLRQETARIYEKMQFLEKDNKQLRESIEKLQENTEQLRELIVATHDIASSPKARGQKRLMQRGNFKLLLEVKAIIEKNKLEWCIDYGTLLGAFRHSGFIPWDDDIDISMPRDDYEKLYQILLEIQDPEKIHVSRGDVIRVFYGKTPLQIDIFALDFYDKKLNREERDNLAQKLIDLHIEKTKFDWHNLYTQESVLVSHTPEQIKSLKEQKICKYVSKSQARKSNFTIFRALEVPTSRIINSFPFDWFFPLKTIQYEGLMLPCPNKTEELLRYYYSDFWAFPRDIGHTHEDISARGNSDTYRIIEEYLSKK